MSVRSVTALFILAAMLATSVLLAQARSESITASLPPVQSEVVDRIAYVGIDGRIRTIARDGSAVEQISHDEGFNTWPTWSPDATKIVYSSVVLLPEYGPRISLRLYDVPGGQDSELFVGEPGVTTLLAEGVVHYPLWSPDSTMLAFVGARRAGLSLYLDSLSDGMNAERLLDNGPLWMAWSYDSRHLLVHRGLEHMLVDAASDNALLNLNEDAAVYRVPAWTPSETTYTVARRVSRTDALLIERDALEGDAQQGRVVTAVQYNPAYLWSPDGGNLALASTGGIMLFNGSEMAIYRDLTISPRNDAALPVRIAGNVLAFFWSPDGQKLAYVSPGNRAGVLRWNVYDASAQEAWPVADFVPSADQVTLFQFFDQYAYSHSPWSPDSEALVFSGVLDTDAVTASSRALQSIPNINVVRADGLSSISIAEGILAVWSPR